MQILKALLVISAITCAGCALFEPQLVPLTETQVASIVSEHGRLQTLNIEQWKEEIAELIGVEVDEIVDIVKTSKKTIVELTPPGGEALSDAGDAFLEKAADDPTPKGLLLGGYAALAALIRVIAGRGRLAGRSK